MYRFSFFAEKHVYMCMCSCTYHCFSEGCSTHVYVYVIVWIYICALIMVYGISMTPCLSAAKRQAGSYCFERWPRVIVAAMFPAWRVVLTACKGIDALANDRVWYNRTYMTKCRVGCQTAKSKPVTGYMHMAPATAILDTITEFKAIWCFFVTNRFSEGQPKEQGRREDQTRQFSSTVTCTCRRLLIGVVASIVALPVTCAREEKIRYWSHAHGAGNECDSWEEYYQNWCIPNHTNIQINMMELRYYQISCIPKNDIYPTMLYTYREWENVLHVSNVFCSRFGNTQKTTASMSARSQLST